MAAQGRDAAWCSRLLVVITIVSAPIREFAPAVIPVRNTAARRDASHAADWFSLRACPVPLELGHALNFSGGACSYRRTDYEFRRNPVVGSARADRRSMPVGHLADQLAESAGEGLEREPHDMPAARADHGAEAPQIGFEDLGIDTVHGRAPARGARHR